jgi:hypothetical protein
MVAKFEINWPSTHSLPSKNSGCISPKKDDTTRQKYKTYTFGKFSLPCHHHRNKQIGTLVQSSQFAHHFDQSLSYPLYVYPITHR